MPYKMQSMSLIMSDNVIPFLKPMIYCTSPRQRVLGRGEYQGYKWTILNLGAHPVAYVQIDQGHPLLAHHNGSALYTEGPIYELGNFVHGGITWFDKDNNNNYQIGWDYTHYGDYSTLPLVSSPDDKKWTTKEIYKDVVALIDALVDRDTNGY